MVGGTQQKIKQTLLNLVASAIKFTSEGEAKFKLRQISQGIGIEVTNGVLALQKIEYMWILYPSKLGPQS